MSSQTTGVERITAATHALRGLTWASTTAPRTVLLLCLALVAGSIYIAKSKLVMKTERADLISPGAEYHQRWMAYTHAFGNTVDMVVVVESESPRDIEAAIDDLGPRIEKESDRFSNVLYRIDKSALMKKGLQYLSPEQLDELKQRLQQLNPILKGQWFLFTLKSQFSLYKQRLESSQNAPHELAAEFRGDIERDLLPHIASVAESLNTFIQNPGEYKSPFQHFMGLDSRLVDAPQSVHYQLNEKGTMGFIHVQPVVKDGDFSGAAAAVNRLREITSEVANRHPKVRIGLTGIPVLESDEMRQSEADMFRATVLSLGLVSLILVVGFRGLRHPLAAIVMVLAAVACSFGYLTLVVGHLNILSVSFAAMLLGLGIDFAIVYLAHYLERRDAGDTAALACMHTAGTIGPGVFTAALTTAAAFFTALLTDFAGVAELGVIAGGGILICCIAAFVLLPAMLTLMDRKVVASQLPHPFNWTFVRRPVCRFCIPVAVMCVAGAAYVSSFGLRVKYDYNLLNLQAPNVESVQVQNQIFQNSDGSVLYAVSLANSREDALRLKAKFEAQPTVARVVELASWMPQHPANETKLLVESISARLKSLPAEPPKPKQTDLDPESVGRRAEDLELVLGNESSHAAAKARTALAAALLRLDQASTEQQAELLEQFQYAMSADLLARLKALASASSDSTPVSPNDFPAPLRTRYVGTSAVDGSTKWLLQIFPKQQIWDREPLRAFIHDLRQVDPEVTGTPIQTFEATRDIVQSYQLIGMYSIITVTIILLMGYRVFQSPIAAIWHSLLAILPPAMGAGITFGILGLTNVDLNPANLIVLPLIVGIGVDGGVHVVHDFRRSHAGRYQTSSATFSAILLSATTTIAGFGSMMVADHRGIRSLGFVLAVGVASCLFVTVVILPAILAWLTVSRPGQERSPSVVKAHAASDGPTMLQFIPVGGQADSRGSARSPLPETGVLPLRRTIG